MKLNKGDLIKIQELLEEINQLDGLIALHRQANDRLMVKQYEARKRKYFDELVHSLLATFPASEMPPVFLIDKLIQKYYLQALENPDVQPALEDVFREFVEV